MSLITLSAAWLSFGDAPLFDSAQLHIESGERICIVGRNGAGKSTLLKILNKEVPLDDGTVVYQPNLIVARLQQDPPRNIAGSVFDFVAQGVSEQAEHIKAYHAILQQVSVDPSDKNLQRMAQLQEILDSQGLWQLDARIRDVLAQLGLAAEAELSSLSGGWLRKAALGRALVSVPDVLLLDEPTNHLDIETISWLEDFLKDFQGSIVFISHDRSFIRAMATRIVDLDRGQLISWPGDYALYLARKDDALRIEELQNAEFDRKLAEEEVWIRQGIKARRTRNEGRVRALEALRLQRSQRREVLGTAKMEVMQTARSGKLVFELEKVNYQSGNRSLIREFSAQVQRGDKIALVGPNGCGKTTLLKLMLGSLKADTGRIHSGTKLEVAYFDQHRLTLDPERTVMDNLADGRQDVEVNGRSRHVLGYLQDFLFHPKRALTPVKALSGGERNRLLLARLFLKPSNLLILDEPTNDLDVETLELLEEKVDGYQGTVLLVSHDREFVDNSVTECWIFEGDGVINRFVGGWHDAGQQRAAARPIRPPARHRAADMTATKESYPKHSHQAARPESGRLSYPLQKELTQLPQQIEQLETKIQALQIQISDVNFFTRDHNETLQTLQALSDAEQALGRAFTRWEFLEGQQNGQ